MSNSSLLTLPHFDDSVIAMLNSALVGGNRQLSWQSGVKEIASLPELLIVCENDRKFLGYALRTLLEREKLTQVRLTLPSPPPQACPLMFV